MVKYMQEWKRKHSLTNNWHSAKVWLSFKQLLVQTAYWGEGNWDGFIRYFLFKCIFFFISHGLVFCLHMSMCGCQIPWNQSCELPCGTGNWTQVLQKSQLSSPPKELCTIWKTRQRPKTSPKLPLPFTTLQQEAGPQVKDRSRAQSSSDTKEVWKKNK